MSEHFAEQKQAPDQYGDADERLNVTPIRAALDDSAHTVDERPDEEYERSRNQSL